MSNITLDRIEREARLLCRAADEDPDEIWAGYVPRQLWEAYVEEAKALHAAGYTIVKREPDEAVIERVATAISNTRFDGLSPVWFLLEERERMVEAWWREDLPFARAAYRAMIEEG